MQTTPPESSPPQERRETTLSRPCISSGVVRLLIQINPDHPISDVYVWQRLVGLYLGEAHHKLFRYLSGVHVFEAPTLCRFFAVSLFYTAISASYRKTTSPTVGCRVPIAM
jgi:hypothetical protein